MSIVSIWVQLVIRTNINLNYKCLSTNLSTRVHEISHNSACDQYFNLVSPYRALETQFS